MKALLDYVESAHNIAEEKETKKFDTKKLSRYGKKMLKNKQLPSREEKEEIARKLEEKIPIETILDEIPDAFIDKLERIHFVTRKDLLNLKVEYNISSEGIIDSNDVVSVGKWVESLQGREDSTIILFKDQNISNENLYHGLKSEDFLLVIMNSAQRVLV
ncbi:hypothetical protein NPIL_604881 [Nephila pilipes]|uniref:Uncharacterized protein n=1 Tax=Nephila pilipes TaxID=299642 RepID=A0A8X6UUG3_NEPPI|nr:hypothetical protein NPIL_604881 [Nephila pilipes]